MEEMRIFESRGVAASAWIWIHAQNEKQRELHFRAAKAGGWVSYDGVHAGFISDCLDFLKDMKKEQLLKHVLLSHDSGWYHVGEPGGGKNNDYNTITDKLLPAMKENGFTQSDIQQIFVTNPANAFTVRVRKK
jgi:phosphotriesterase-related protein